MARISIVNAVLLLFLLSFSYGDAEADHSVDHSYVGSGGCACHRAELNDWKRSKHGKAFDLLKPGKRRSAKKKAALDPSKDYTRDERCVKCHVVGYKEKGGFSGTESTKALYGVGCEMCHGAGSKYRKIHKSKGLTFSKTEVMKEGQLYATMDEAVCRRCHYQKATPFKPELDKKYVYDFDEALTNPRLFHEIYPMEGKH